MDMTTRTASANRVTGIGMAVNLGLTVFKAAAGILGHSGAMLADAAHSLSDIVTDAIVLTGFRAAGRPADRDHGYGHGKYETLAAAAVGVSLLAVGGLLLLDGSVKVWAAYRGEPLGKPGAVALLAAIVSLAVKETMYRCTLRVGQRVASTALIANAWHHRSDALSSLAVIFGVAGAILLGERWHILDPLAAMAVSVFIVRVALRVFSGSVRELSEASLPEAIEAEIMRLATADPAASDAHNLRTRRIGGVIAIDIHIRVDPNMRVVDAHAAACRLEQRLRVRFGPSTYVSIHVEPQYPANEAAPG